MGIFSDMGIEDAVCYPALNTSTSLDIATGAYEKGDLNRWYLNGGLPSMFGIGGRAGYYKSTTLDSILVNCLHNYPNSEALKIDTESNALTPKKRMRDICKYQYGDDYDTEALLGRLRVTNLSATSGKEFEEMVYKIGLHKKDHKKDYMVETPFLDIRTGNPLKMYIPTFIVVDSLSMLRFGTESEEDKRVSVESSQRNMEALKDGQFKTRLITDWSRMAYKYGIYFLLSAQVDDSFVADEYNKPEKQNQFVKNNDRYKYVGAQFEYLTNTLLNNYAPSPIVSSTDRKAPEYTSEGAGVVEINEINSRIIRCKAAPAGTFIPMVQSQNYGILSGLSYYHFLKKSGDFGFTVNGIGRSNRYCVLMPDTLLKRQTIIDSLKNNYELNRALEIMFQLKWIIDRWGANNCPFNLPKTAEEFVDKIASGGDLTISDIVNSRGYWTYDKETKRPYMSIFDILSILDIKK